jgi:hypothetical protein
VKLSIDVTGFNAAGCAVTSEVRARAGYEMPADFAAVYQARFIRDALVFDCAAELLFDADERDNLLAVRMTDTRSVDAKLLDVYTVIMPFRRGHEETPSVAGTPGAS